MEIENVINNKIIDYLIEDILKDGNYERLSYYNKTSLCKLVVRKGTIPGRALA